MEFPRRLSLPNPGYFSLCLLAHIVTTAINTVATYAHITHRDETRTILISLFCAPTR